MKGILIINHLLYLLAWSVVRLIRLLPLKVCFVLGYTIGLLLWIILPRYRRLSKKNFKIAFGEQWSDQKVSYYTLRHFLILGANIVSSIKIPALTMEKLRSSLLFENPKNWEQWILGKELEGRGTVAALSHCGNWEINAQIADFVKPRLAGCIYQALRNPSMDNLLNRDRRIRGVATFDRKKGLKEAVDMLKRGGIVGLLIDQHAGNAGMWMPFFGKLASTSPLAANLAQRTDSLLVMVNIRTIGLARWSIYVSEPILTQGREIASITMDLNLLLEKEIQRSPSDWFWVHNRWKLPNPNFLLAGVKRGVYLPEAIAKKNLQSFHVLVRSPNWLGDACMAIPAIRAIKAGRPDLHLTILSPQKLAPLWHEILEVDEVLEIPKKVSPFTVSQLIRNTQSFEVAILLPNSLRSALEVWLAGIPRRVGRSIHRGRRLLNQKISISEKLQPMHQSEEMLFMVRAMGGMDPAPSPQRASPEGQTRIGLCPGAEYGPAKCWPIENYRKVMVEISQQHDMSWVIFGTAKEIHLSQILVREFQYSFENLCGKTTIQELISELKRCTLLLSNDTGTMHLADLLGVPVVAIFGSTEPERTGPIGKPNLSHQILRMKVDCSPCYRRCCPIDFRCMYGITPQMVVATILDMLPKMGKLKNSR